jgi:hypothetical protein
MSATSAMMSLGNSYLAQMSGDGQASGEDCWEWSATYGQDMTLSIRACEETAGTVNWSVSVTEAGGEPCTFMTGTAAGNNLSGSWSFFNCPDEELVMRESWSTDGEGHWELDLEIWDAETEAPLARPTDTPPYAFHYEQNADGSGECEELEDGALVWRMVWVVEGETVGGEFCTYVGGEIDECYDFGEGWEPELPEAPPEFEFDSELLEDEDVPDVFLGLASPRTAGSGVRRTAPIRSPSPPANTRKAIRTGRSPSTAARSSPEAWPPTVSRAPGTSSSARAETPT